MGISETSDHILINIKIPDSSKTQNDDLKNMDVICAFNIKIES